MKKIGQRTHERTSLDLIIKSYIKMVKVKSLNRNQAKKVLMGKFYYIFKKQVNSHFHKHSWYLFLKQDVTMNAPNSV